MYGSYSCKCWTLTVLVCLCGIITIQAVNSTTTKDPNTSEQSPPSPTMPLTAAVMEAASTTSSNSSPMASKTNVTVAPATTTGAGETPGSNESEQGTSEITMRTEKPTTTMSTDKSTTTTMDVPTDNNVTEKSTTTTTMDTDNNVTELTTVTMDSLTSNYTSETNVTQTPIATSTLSVWTNRTSVSTLISTALSSDGSGDRAGVASPVPEVLAGCGLLVICGLVIGLAIYSGYLEKPRSKFTDEPRLSLRRKLANRCKTPSYDEFSYKEKENTV